MSEDSLLPEATETAFLSTDEVHSQRAARHNFKEQSRTQNELENEGRRLRRSFCQFLDMFEPLEHWAAEEPGMERNIGSSGTHSFYQRKLKKMVQDGKMTLAIEYSHLFAFDDKVSEKIVREYSLFEPFLKEGIFRFCSKYHPEYVKNVAENEYARSLSGRQEVKKSSDRYGSCFHLALLGVPTLHRVRELVTKRLGQLVRISGIVTRTSEVRPELFRGTFQCDVCGSVASSVIQQFRYTEPSVCRNEVCQNRRSWTLLFDDSQFVDWQKIRLQEHSSEMPSGSMPRTVDVIARHELVESCKPGDHLIVTGCLVVIPDVSSLVGKLDGVVLERQDSTRGDGVGGIKELGVRELTHRLAFIASSFEGLKSSEADELSASELEEARELSARPHLHRSLVSSMAPGIFGHLEIKEGLLLQLFGGIHKETEERISLRGDINVCLVGDPGTAKSQFLKYVTSLFPRSVYTSGKASSAAGLTACVVKDEETGSFTIEAGALMLADNGICAIDEFDKMDLSDQVAIHEAMEQQTISISKAGIQTTLNARVSLLAAANPIGGRYDRQKTIRQNLSLSSPIMSRFDLFFVVLDEQNENTDHDIARHILELQDSRLNPEIEPDILMRYISYSRRFNPQLTSESAALLTEYYTLLRQSTNTGGNYRTTVRQLESLLRLSEALARLHCDHYVQERYVREAYRLVKSTLIRVETANVLFSDEKTEMPYEKFKRLSEMLVLHLQQLDELGQSLTRTEAIEWCLEQLEDEIETEAELVAQRKTLELLLDRLLHTEGVLFELGEGKTLNVHPNHSFE